VKENDEGKRGRRVVEGKERAFRHLTSWLGIAYAAHEPIVTHALLDSHPSLPHHN